jgi:dihydrofolate reductase
LAIKAIVCIGANGVMGKDGTMPWGDMPLDGAHFRRLTEGHVVVMGRKTFESMGEKPLPNRINLVLSRTLARVYPGTAVVRDIDSLLDTHKRWNSDFWVIGGSEVYRQLLPYIEEFYVTTVGEEFEGDTYFPDIHQSYGWAHEYLGMETRVVAQTRAVEVVAHLPEAHIEYEPLPTKEYQLVFRKFTKL